MTPADKLALALLTARDHININALEISHCKDAAIIREAIAEYDAQQAAGAVPELPELAAWKAACKERTAATEVYNAALLAARAKDEAAGFGHTSVNAEYQAMNDAAKRAQALVRPLLDTLLAAAPAAPTQAPAVKAEQRRVEHVIHAAQRMLSDWNRWYGDHGQSMPVPPAGIVRTQEMLAELLSELHEPPAVGAEGMVLVPVEPTREMMEAGEALPPIMDSDLRLRRLGWSLLACQNRRRWAAMLAAAPTTPAQAASVVRDSRIADLIPAVPAPELTDEWIDALVKQHTWFNGSHAITNHRSLIRAALAQRGGEAIAAVSHVPAQGSKS